MIPVHFGRSERLLFGIYTPAEEPRARRGVVICNPWGMEALRAHRALRHLGVLLSQHGVDVLRFDYSGTGDSFGDLASTRLGDWVEDTEHAIDELLALSGNRQVGIAGLRLGSWVAATAAARRPGQVDRVLLWEPIVTGAEHVTELSNGTSPNRKADHGTAGFPIPAQFRDDLSRTSIAGLPGPRFRVNLVRSAPTSTSVSAEISAKEVVLTEVAAPPCWREEGEFGAGAVPVDLLRRITEWLK